MQSLNRLIHISQSACLMTCIDICNAVCMVNNDNDVTIYGTAVMGRDADIRHSFLKVMVDFQDASGRKLFTATSAQQDISGSVFSPFNLLCRAVDRFFDLNELCSVSICPVLSAEYS